jgi:hypothetical protein
MRISTPATSCLAVVLGVSSWLSYCEAFAPLHLKPLSPGFEVSSSRQDHDGERRSVISGLVGVGILSILSPSASAANKALSEEYRQGTAALAEMEDQAPVPREAYKKLSSGVVYADLRPGNGEEVKAGSKVNLQWVLRKSNGYFVDSSEVNGSVPFIFAVGDGTAIQGVDEGIRGMKAGGVRRLLIPPSLAFVEGLEDGKPGPLPVGFGPRQQMRRVMSVRKDVPGEYVFLEVQATRVR